MTNGRTSSRSFRPDKTQFITASISHSIIYTVHTELKSTRALRSESKTKSSQTLLKKMKKNLTEACRTDPTNTMTKRQVKRTSPKLSWSTQSNPQKSSCVMWRSSLMKTRLLKARMVRAHHSWSVPSFQKLLKIYFRTRQLYEWKKKSRKAEYQDDSSIQRKACGAQVSCHQIDKKYLEQLLKWVRYWLGLWS